MSNRKKLENLINPTEDQMFEREPLMKFSFYLSGRNNTLLSISDEILENLDICFSNRILKHELLDRASTLMWLWTLGAYEVIRTMCQAKSCFSENFVQQIAMLKKELERVRMPNSKMEELQRENKGKKIPVNSNRSPDGWDLENKDLLVGDPENAVSCRYLLNLYTEVICSAKITDVKAHHKESYGI